MLQSQQAKTWRVKIAVVPNFFGFAFSSEARLFTLPDADEDIERSKTVGRTHGRISIQKLNSRWATKSLQSPTFQQSLNITTIQTQLRNCKRVGEAVTPLPILRRRGTPSVRSFSSVLLVLTPHGHRSLVAPTMHRPLWSM
jgi:hypothetical protein